MTELQTYFADAASSNMVLEFYVLCSSLKDANVELYKLDLEAESANLLTSNYLSILKEKILSTNEEHDLLELDTHDHKKAVWLGELESDHCTIGLQNIVSKAKSNNSTTFISNRENIKNIKGLVVVSSKKDITGEEVHIFYPYGGALLERGRFLSVGPKYKSRLQTPDYDVFRLPSSLLVSTLEKYFYVFSVSEYESKFGYEEAIQKLATNALNVIRESNFDFDITLFQKVADKGGANRKRLINVGVLLSELDIDAKKIRETYHSQGKYHGLLTIDQSEKNGFRISSQKEVVNLLELMNQDILEHAFTGDTYKVKVKKLYRRASPKPSNPPDGVELT